MSTKKYHLWKEKYLLYPNHLYFLFQPEQNYVHTDTIHLSGEVRNVQKFHDPKDIEEILEKNDMSNQTKLLSKESNVDLVNALGGYRELASTA